MDIKVSNVGDVPLIYKKNTDNERFQLKYVLDMGTDHNQKLKMAVDYLKYLGTNKISSTQKQEEFYKIGCEMNVSCNTEKIKITKRIEFLRPDLNDNNGNLAK